ncbi:hypothetical protein PMY56_16535 [Clostridium tertium]|uniref:hypothetical protein n=1 Tax=Clostridium tertium TaxID=1559 RepID=UPI00232DC127|nr:hypothetical protein [Clostridium tertium]MDB1927741.1 hypothetical protein [Clostridium tertium]MDB1931554.1 hypothetical protein [Clostridium tertium]
MNTSLSTIFSLLFTSTLISFSSEAFISSITSFISVPSLITGTLGLDGSPGF